MNLPRTPAARAAISRYRDASVGDRFHVRVRWLTCPVAEIERRVPLVGRVLDVGCGHGLVSHYVALCAPGRTVVGVDIDEHKIAVARAAAACQDPATTPTFDVIEPGTLPAGPWDAVVIADVLYLLGRPAREQLLDRCAAALAPGGVLVVKETDTHPRWKHRLATAQELVSTKVLRITAGDHLEFASSKELAERLRQAGLATTVDRLDRGHVHPHVVVSGVRPG